MGGGSLHSENIFKLESKRINGYVPYNGNNINKVDDRFTVEFKSGIEIDV